MMAVGDHGLVSELRFVEHVKEASHLAVQWRWMSAESKFEGGSSPGSSSSISERSH